MIDATTETIISLTEAARSLPPRRESKRPHVSCIYRWTTCGCRGVVLESIQVGGTRCTSREALQRFFDRLTEAATAAQPPILPRPPLTKTRLRQIEAAERRLRAAGI